MKIPGFRDLWIMWIVWTDMGMQTLFVTDFVEKSGNIKRNEETCGTYYVNDVVHKKSTGLYTKKCA